MATNKDALFHKRIARVERINQGQNAALKPRRMRRVLRILQLNHYYLWERDHQSGRSTGLDHPGKGYRRVISRAR